MFLYSISLQKLIIKAEPLVSDQKGNMPIFSVHLKKVDTWKKPGYLVQRRFGYFLTYSKITGPLQLIIHVEQNLYAGEQETHCDKAKTP